MTNQLHINDDIDLLLNNCIFISDTTGNKLYKNKCPDSNYNDMAIFVKTDSPSSLVDNIREGISKKEIETWLCDSDGDFTHDTDQWRYQAWIRPHVEEGQVVFGIICRKDRNLSVTDYAIYHGRFIEMLLGHFDKTCKAIEVSPLATKYDTISHK